MIRLESLADAVLVVDAVGKILRLNAPAEALFGYSRAELIGRPIDHLIPQRFRLAHEEHRQRYQASPAPRAMGRGTLTARHKTGRDVPVEVMLSPDPDGSVVAVARDATQRRDLERFRGEFMGYISHDLKNPLSVITLQARLLAQQLEGSGLDDEKRAVDVIAQSAAFIDKLVRELLEMAYLESDQVQITSEATDLAAFLKRVLERTVSTRDRTRVQLEVRAPATGLIEANRIERVVANFVQNAIKYAPEDSPIVVRLEARAGEAIISVCNEGTGLTPEEASYVFDKYRRTERSRSREGLGLGLYISRKIVEAHGGRIGVESSPGRETRFFFSVPLTKEVETGSSPALEPVGQGDEASRLRGLKVLLVDDEVNAISALTSLLRDEGLDAEGVTSGEEALARAEVRRPDVVVLDVEMPGMSGVAMLERLRGRFPGLPAIIMSGYTAADSGIADARASTGAAFIGKPVDFDELLGTLGRLFSSRPGTR